MKVIIIRNAIHTAFKNKKNLYANELGEKIFFAIV